MSRRGGEEDAAGEEAVSAADTETRVGYTRTSSEAGEQRGLTHDVIVAGIALGASGATDVAKPTLTAVGEAIRDKIVPNAKGDDPKK